MKRWHLFTLGLLLICIVFIAIIAYNYYAPPKIRQSYRTMHHNDDTLRIAYIGDSWAAMHKMYDRKMEQMIEDKLHRPVIVLSYGICGLTSKEIYEYLFNDSTLKNFIKNGFDYCVISAGINDTYKKMSTAYYQESMKGIISFMEGNHIHPIIIEIPDYDIQKAYDHQTVTKKLLRQFSMFVTGSPKDCKQTYRDALRQTLGNRVDIVGYQEWNNNYSKDQKILYSEDGMHLKEEGYNRLDSCIITHIR